MILGHQKQLLFLQKAAKLNRISHAYLFYGPQHLGKRTVAVEFIKLLSCQNPHDLKEPCQECRSCLDIQKGTYPDLTVIESKRTETSQIKISQIKKLQWELALCPYHKTKAVVIDEAERMNQEAQNCFLKTLEEPKGKTLLILTTEHPEALLPTILSRVEKIKFSPLPIIEIKDHLKTRGADAKLAEEIALISEGNPGIAIDLFSNPEQLIRQKQTIEELIRLLSSGIAFRFQYAKTLAQDPQELLKILDVWTRYFRNIFLQKLQQSQKPSIQNYSIIKLKNILKALQNTGELITNTNVNPRLALEMLMMEL